uniref:FAD-binding PCMH-type domain-containing protein n=1 Tax=Salix viminalis TaxID=40686 RepID=A0A6N2K770_SALVM
MKSPSSLMIPFLFLFLFSFLWAASADRHEDFLQCLESQNFNSISKVIYTPINSSYSSVLQFSVRNLRFNTSATPKPLVIVTALNEAHIQATIRCSQKHGLEIRVRSGGHDYEGLSYVAAVVPFVVIDLINMRTVTVDDASKTAWIQTGATLGEVYYRIAEKSRTLAFPAGVCPTVGVGGHISGGGTGMIMRKYGLAVDNIVDAQLIDVKGRILDRASMGEDLFWAIRGGGGNTFGVVVAWKLELVPVPASVTVFNVTRILTEQDATKLIHRWQYAIEKFDEDLFSRIFIWRASSNQEGKIMIQAAFTSLFLGGVDRLLSLMQESFPELGLVKEDCIEMSWIESTVYFAQFPRNTPLDVLLDRIPQSTSFFKGKTDFVREPIPEIAFQGIWDRLNQVDVQSAELQFTAYGGKMDEIAESSTPFPHRAGTLFQIHYGINWEEEGIEAYARYTSWIRKLYSYMTPYVSKKPRQAYVNYRDLDLGVNNLGNTSYKQASIWGTKYFKNNFDRLVHVKTEVDPANFFRNEQSIPPLSSW